MLTHWSYVFLALTHRYVIPTYFLYWRGTTDAIFILRQLQEKHINAVKNLYFAFVDLEKAFDRVPRQVIWWAMRKLGVQEWLIRWVQSLYRGARSSVRIGDTLLLQRGIPSKSRGAPGISTKPPTLHHGPRSVVKGVPHRLPWEVFYADDLVIISKTLNELLEKLKTWKKGMEAKGLKANMTKTKLMISGPELNLLRDSGKYHCVFCRKGVGSDVIYCTGCAHWVHKRFSGIKGTLANRTNFQCKRCKGIARPIDGRPTTSISVEENKLDVVYEFCYLGDMIDAGGGCERASMARTRTAFETPKYPRRPRDQYTAQHKETTRTAISGPRFHAPLHISPPPPGPAGGPPRTWRGGGARWRHLM